jgi:hypothetical protein
MPIITAAEASALSATNSGAITAELNLIDTAIEARATAGFYFLDHELTVSATKAAVIAALTADPNYYTVTVLDDEVTLHIVWPGEPA